jgi:hypothetical protein
MSVIFITNYFLVGETFLLTDLIIFNIKLVQYFEYAYRDRTCVRVLIGVSARMYISIYVYTLFLKNKHAPL